MKKLSNRGFLVGGSTQAWSTITNTPTTLSGYGITDAQPLDSDLTAIAGLSTTGLVARTGAGTAATRTITGTANQVTVTNGNGISGDPTLALPQSIATTSTPQFAKLGIGVAPTGILDVAKPSSGGRFQVVNEGADSYNVVASRNAADSAYLPLTIRSGPVVFVPGTGSMTIDASSNLKYVNATVESYFGGDGTVALVGTTSNHGLSLYTANVARIMVSTSGAVKFINYGAGTLVTDSSGNITASSDASLKTVTGSFTRGLADVLKLTPRTYRWNESSGMNTEDENVGFVAQEVLNAVPEAVGQFRTVETKDKEGKKDKKREAASTLTLSDRPLIAALVNAVKELKAENDELRKRLDKLETKK